MTPYLAAVFFLIGSWLFIKLDQDQSLRTSKALWIPTIWLWIVASRPASQVLAIAGFGQIVAYDSPDQYLDGSPLDRGVYTGLLLVGVIVLLRRGPEVGRILRANGPLMIFFLYCALSVSWSDYPDVAFKRWVKAFADLVMVLVVLTDPGRSMAVRRFLLRPAFFLIPLSVLFIKYFPDLGRVYNRWTWTWMYIGVTNGKNLLGGICVIFGLASVWRFLNVYQDPSTRERTRRLLAHGTFLAMVMWLLWTANSMTSLSCFVLSSGLMAAMSAFRSLARRPLLLIFTVIVISASALFSGFGGGALEAMGRDPTLTGRTAVWDLVLSVAGSPLVGTGFESFWLGKRLDKIWSHYQGLNEAHNGYLEVFLNLGWIGLALLGAVVVKGYKNVIGTLRWDPDLGRLKLAYFVVGLVYSFTEAGFRMLTPVWIGFLLSVVVVPETRQSSPLKNRFDHFDESWGDGLEAESDAHPHPVSAGYAPNVDHPASWISAEPHRSSKLVEEA